MKKKKNKSGMYDQQDLQELIDTDAQYLILLGERSNGKSYAVKWHEVVNAWKNEREFIYLRRWGLETKRKRARDYFNDLEIRRDGAEPIKELTDGEWTFIDAFQGELFMARYNEKGTIERHPRRIGHIMNLTGDTHFKSGQFPRVDSIIFEEFITADGYVPREVNALLSIVSTVFRRGKGRVYMIGNTIVPVCPYFNEWDIHIDKIEQGTINIFNFHTLEQDENGDDITVRIALQYLEHSDAPTRMIFGKHEASITHGEWETFAYPQPPENPRHYPTYATMVYEWGIFRFRVELKYCEEIGRFLYVYPMGDNSKVREHERVVTDRYTVDMDSSDSLLNERRRYDRIFNKLLEQRKIFFSDALTGTNFFTIRKERGKW